MKIYFNVRNLSGDLVLKTAPVDVDTPAFDAARAAVLDLKQNGSNSYRVFRAKVKTDDAVAHA